MESGFLKLVAGTWGDICLTYAVRKAELSGKDVHLEEQENNSTSKELGEIKGIKGGFKINGIKSRSTDKS